MTLASPEHALSTLERDGSRHWIKPRLSHGHFLTRRRIVAYSLMALFFMLPFVRRDFPYLAISGKPMYLLDIVHRKFTLFGFTFLPTDTLLLALAMLFIFVSIFLFTAISGRLWCGWACPQTVYMEFLYRPLERLFEGTRGRGGAAKKKTYVRRAGYFLAALLVTAIPAHTFLAYFVGVENLSHWITHSPLTHPTAFLVMAATTALMFFDFYWFREQLCLIACPYGRFQSGLLDKFSMIVSYDRKRGEPRGKAHGSLHLKLIDDHPQPATHTGDCVDCGMCVTTCPTGIDIRDGLQMECVNCTQCIDACNSVMEKIGRPPGLIRYSSQAQMENADAGTKVKNTRFRLVFYPIILAIIAIAWVLIFSSKRSADVTILRNAGTPYTLIGQGDSARIANPLKLKLTNRTESEAKYHFELIDFPEARIDATDNPVTVPAGASLTSGFLIEVPQSAFSMGKRETWMRVTDEHGFSDKVLVRLLGPTEDSHDEHSDQGAKP